MLLTALSGLALAACGGTRQIAHSIRCFHGRTRQDANEPQGKFPVQITKSEFPNRQRLAETSSLELGVKNTGDKTIPDLSITISTDPNANESFSVRSQQAGLADHSDDVVLAP